MEKNSLWILLAASLLVMLVLTACGGTSPSAPDQNIGVVPEPPAEFAGKINPFNGDSAAAEAGKQIYNANCASCHGLTGMGEGPVAASLNPAPKPLARESELSDAYLFWRISAGGGMAPFKSAMPSWKSFLKEEQIWQVIAYLRTLMQ